MSIINQRILNSHLELTVSADTRVFVIGDLHGEITQLNALLDSIEFNFNEDILISTGDLIDRGEDSSACLQLFHTTHNFYHVLGNHEQLAIDAIKHQDFMLWFYNGGDWYNRLNIANKYQIISCLYDLEQSGFYTISVIKNNNRTVIAHADIPNQHFEFGERYTAENKQYLLWNRESINNFVVGKNMNYTGADRFIFGHTPLKEITHFNNVTYIDTAACYNTKYSKLSHIKI